MFLLQYPCISIQNNNFSTGNGQIHFEEMLVTIIKREEGLDQLTRAFGALDKNGDGQLDRVELEAVFATVKWNIGANSVDEILKKYDNDQNGSIDYKG